MRRIALVGTLASLLLVAPAHAATLEPVGNFANPTYVTSYPTDPDKLLVVERAGRVRLVEGGATSTFLDAASLVGAIEGERGMWSIALAPDFDDTGRLYAFYAGSVTGGDLQLDEFTAAGGSVDLATRRPVLTIEHRDSPNHNGGQLQFGSDGYLYISTGDGDRRAINAQELTNLLGKILRIDPRPSGAAAYSVPADNPFVGAAGADEIWSYGLRNPYRFSFDGVTGALAIGDVGRQRIEEVDYAVVPDPGRGDNYGWPCFEGSLVQNTSPACSSPADLVFPIHEYAHEDGNCSIIGGYVARDPALPELYGRYLDADLCLGEIRSLLPELPLASDDRGEGLTVNRPVSFGEDACRRLYVVSLLGPISRLAGDEPTDCSAGFGAAVGDVLTVGAGLGVANRIVVTSAGSGADDWVIQDNAAPITAGPGCVQARPRRIRCPKAAVSTLAVDAGDRNDRVTTPDGIDARLDGGAGDDQLTTGDGADLLIGGIGRDRLDGGANPDVLDGGAHRDVAVYSARAADEPVTVSLDGVANDGGALDGGGDNVLVSVENVIGGAGDDTLIGNDFQNILTGGPGADELHGLGANDTIYAQDGVRDTITCGAGPKDVLFADPFDDFPHMGPDACEILK